MYYEMIGFQIVTTLLRLSFPSMPNDRGFLCIFWISLGPYIAWLPLGRASAAPRPPLGGPSALGYQILLVMEMIKPHPNPMPAPGP